MNNQCVGDELLVEIARAVDRIILERKIEKLKRQLGQRLSQMLARDHEIAAEGDAVASVGI